MKRTLWTSTLSTLLVLMLCFVTSCRDDCRNNYSCEYGDCIDGVCECADGYEGENCDILMGERFLGNYVVGYDCNNFSGDTIETREAIVEIFDVVREDVGMRGNGLMGSFDFLTAQVSDGIHLEIEPQVFGDWVIEGSGDLETPVVSGGRVINFVILAQNLSDGGNSCNLIFREVP